MLVGRVGRAVPRLLTQYRVFIGSPGGLNEERICFRNKLEKYTEMHSEPRNVAFQPVGWEETIGGVGRPQELINEDLRQCDYAVFVLHDRWGSPTGDVYSSGVEEEWALTEELYRVSKIRNIALFFKKVDPRQLADPGTQLTAVLTFKKRIEEEKRYLFRQYDAIGQFAEALEAHLSKWLLDHETAIGGFSSSAPTAGTNIGTLGASRSDVSPSFDYWISEATRLLEPDTLDHTSALFCALKATGAAKSDIEWAQARNTAGVAQFHIGRVDEAIAAFTAVAERFSASIETDRRYWHARALINKGATLGALDRSADAIAVYDNLIARFGAASELPLREQVANALFNTGVTLGALDRGEEAIAFYDDLIARFGGASELALREQVANALINKGATLGALDRSADAIAVYEDLIARFGGASELPLREQVANALISKAITLGALSRSADAITAYDDLITRFGGAFELPLREQVANALFNKGFTLGALGHSEDAIGVYDALIDRFGTATELPLHVQVANALYNKGFRLSVLGRSADEIVVYDEILTRFGTATELPLRIQVANALFNKGFRLGALGRSEDAIDIYEALIDRFGTATELPLRGQVAKSVYGTLVRTKAENRCALLGELRALTNIYPDDPPLCELLRQLDDGETG
jgi:tetratricopeptide (TPR) repeat protein